MPDPTQPDLTSALIHEITEIVFGPTDTSVEPCDMIFVFGGTHPGLWETAAQAYHAGLGKVVLATGGWKAGVRHHASWNNGETPEAHVIRRELIRLSVPENVIICEDKSTNSLENVLLAKQVFDFSSIKSILVVCKNYACGRQCRTLQQHLPETIRIIPYPFDTEAGTGPVITRHTWMQYPEGRRVVLSQLAKIIKYGKLGHLVPVDRISAELETMVKHYL